MLPPTPAPQSARATAARRRVRHEPSSSEEDEEDDGDNNEASVRQVIATPSSTAMRSQRASKTAAMSKIAAKTATAFPGGKMEDDQSDVTSDESSAESGDDLDV